MEWRDEVSWQKDWEEGSHDPTLASVPRHKMLRNFSNRLMFFLAEFPTLLCRTF